MDAYIPGVFRFLQGVQDLVFLSMAGGPCSVLMTSTGGADGSALRKTTAFRV